jgi:hypothetical protein
MKKQIHEIISAHELEPSLLDIYVEGETDAAFLEWFLLNKDKKDAYVISINLVDVPDSIFDEFSQYRLNKSSDRDKLLALSYKLNEKFSEKKRIMCIGDKDFDTFLGRLHQNSYFRYTDYQSFELYLFNVRIIEKFLRFVVRKFPQTADDLLRDMSIILQDIFLIRVSNEILHWGMKWIDFCKYVSYKKNVLIFTKDDFIHSYLSKNSRLSEKNEFVAILKEVKKILLVDARHNIRGHDFTYLLYCIIRMYAKRLGNDRRGKAADFANCETCDGALRGCAEVRDIECEPLFQELLVL